MMLRWLMVAVLLMVPSVAVAEAGVRLVICKTGSCSCSSVTCACGQVCTGSGCQSSTAAFCQDDSECAASCGDFVCEFDNCSSGKRAVDGGFVAGDGGGSGPMIDGGAGGADPVRQCGCNSGVALLWLALIFPFTLLHRRSRGGPCA